MVKTGSCVWCQISDQEYIRTEPNYTYQPLFIGDPGAIRTRDLQIRNLLLYPAELRDRIERFNPFRGQIEEGP